MLRYLGAGIQERAGSRVSVKLGGRTVIFHRPHPAKEANRYLVRDVRALLTIVGDRAMMYKGYTARYEFDKDERVLHGHVDGIDDIVSFVSETLEGLEREFHTSVDVYLEVCAEDGREPDRPRAPQKRAVS